MRIACFLSIIGSLQLFDLVYIIWGTVRVDDCWYIDHGNIHGP